MVSLQHAIALHQSGDLVAAAQAYRAVLQQQPRQPDALSLLGVVLEGLGQTEAAVASIRQAVALDPQAALFRLHLGNALMANGQPSEAIAEFRHATRLQPDLAEAHYNLGNVLRHMNEPEAAIAAYRACLVVAPHAHVARNNLALLISAAGDYDGAIAELRYVLAAEPLNAQARVNLANIADEAGRFELSYQEAKQAAADHPTVPDALFALGLAATRRGFDDEAIATYRNLLTIMPDHYAAWDNYAQLLQARGEWALAATAYSRARTLAPDDATINYHAALFDLLIGRLTQGFAGYEWRFRAVQKLKRIEHSTAPVWDGGDPAGKTILVVDEQGYGDSLMFCRYLPLLQAKGARVIYACRTPLQPLLRGMHGADELVLMSAATTTPCDAHISLMDLPHWLGVADEVVPATVPYIPAPAPYHHILLQQETRLKVGIVWAGNRAHKHDHRRSIPFQSFSTLFGVAGVQLYNLLRPEDWRGDEAAHFATYDIADLGSVITDFATSAACVQALDLIITVDTATAHLAGALGKPVWVLLPTGPDWRWQTERSDSPWYPTATLYRQTELDDWTTILARVRQDLAQLANS